MVINYRKDFFMYITLQTTKRNLGLFNLEIKDIVLASVFALAFIILFSLGFIQTAIITIISGVFLLIPVSFSQQNRIYKLILLVGKFLFKKKNFYYHLENNEVRRDQYNSYIEKIKKRKNNEERKENN